MNLRYPPLRRIGAATAAAALSAGLLTGLAASATAAPLASGSDWTATVVSGGIEVTLDPTTPLPIVSDAPTLVINGEDAGIATEAADGSLSVLVPGSDAAAVESVELGWASGDTAKVTPTNSPVTDTADTVAPVSKKKLRALVAAAADGSEAGSYAYTEDDYDFGDQAIDLASIGGIRGEMTGRIYLPTTGGARPTVILLHGRHSYCTVPAGGGSVSNPNRWPCISPQVDIPSYKGYDVLGQTLATQGYAVVSISANAINANDNQLAPDNGAQARGQLVLDSLTMLKKANAGQAVSYHDNARDLDVDLATALTVDTASTDLGTPATGTLTPADLVGRFDLTNVGLMGHSRGGEGVVSAVTLNQALAEPFGITSVLPLAPVDFGRMTVADTPMLVMLPYCDGDVSNQQGQHFSDDSRRAFGDSVLRSTVWVMGANHNFFNTVWTPGKYSLSTSDDWGATSTDAVCGPNAATNQRLSADEQYSTGVAVMAAWFRLTLGHEDALLPMFDGTTKPALTSVPDADLRTIASQPAAGREDIATFETLNARTRTYGTGTLTLCASASGRTLPQQLPPCATTSTLRSTSAMPHWTPASYAPNVPATPMSKLTWTSSTGELRVTVPAGQRDASSYQTLSFNTAPDETVTTGTDMTVSVYDGSGHTWSSLVSALNPYAVSRMPISSSTTLNKIVLQQVSIPLASLGSVDTSDIREVRFTAATGADGTATGGAYLSDLSFSTSGVGTPVVTGGRPTIGVAATTAEEGAAADEKQAAVVLSKPAATEVSGWFTLIGATTSSAKAALAARLVTFAPGQTCVPVTVPTYGDSAASTTLSTAYKMSITNPQGVVTGDDAFAYLTVREDDGTGSEAVQPAPAVGVQGDVCAEYAARSEVQDLTASEAQPEPGDTVTVTGSGYRSGESVSFSDGATVLGTAIADATGAVSYPVVLAEDAAFGPHTITALGAGSARTSQVGVTVLAASTTTLSISPAAPAIKEAVTLTAAVPAAADGDVVTFLDGGTVLGTGTVTGGVATYAVPAGFLAGEHSLSATYAETATTGASASNVVSFTLVKGTTTTVVSLADPTTTVGTGTTGTITVAGVGTGSVTLTYGDVTETVDLVGGTGSFEIPGTLAAGTYTLVATYAGSDEDEGSSSTEVVYEVVKAVTSTSVTLAAASTPYGTGTTGTVTVDGVDTGSATVSYGTASTTVALSGGAGTFTLPASLGAGDYSVVATYAGTDATEASTSTPVGYAVVKKATRLALKSSPTSVKAGKKVTLTATVSGLVGSPRSTVTFKVAGRTVKVAITGARATVKVVVTGNGKKAVTATYAGDANHGASTAKATVTVTKK